MPTFRSHPSGHTDSEHRDFSWRHRSVIFQFSRVDDVSTTPDLGEGHPTDVPRLSTPPPPPGSYSNLLRSPAAVPVRLRRFGLFTTDPRSSLTPFYRPLCGLVRMFEIKHAQTLWLQFFVRIGGCGVWTKTVVFEARLAVAFIDLFFTIGFF